MDDFGKKAKEGFLSGISFLKGKAKETMDLQKLGSQHKVLETRRDECLLEVGQRVFVFYEMDRVQTLEEADWEPIRPRIDEVKDINRKLQEIDEQMAALKAGIHVEATPKEHSEDAPLQPSQVRIVLIETHGDANIGAVARSMACFGASELYLVRPNTPVRDTAYHWACHARDVLENRKRVDTLGEALEGTTLVVGTSARHGIRRYRMVTPPQLVTEVLPHFPEVKLALVFGNEESGMDNDSIKLCHRLVKIPTQPDHSSLNLAHTVSLLLYELLGRGQETDLGGKPKQLSSLEGRKRMLEEVSLFMGERSYPSYTGTLEEEMTKLGDIAERAALEEWEVRFLLGMIRHLRNFDKGYIKGDYANSPHRSKA